MKKKIVTENWNRGFHTSEIQHVSLFALNLQLRACLHGGGVPQIGEVTRLDGVTLLSI